MKISPANLGRRETSAFTSNTVIVKGKDDELNTWKEQTTLITVSRTGAGFFLSRACEVGRLLSLLTQIPTHLRSYHREREYYRVWGIVQHCLPSSETGKFQVGIAFIGREAPSAYYHDVRRCFRIVGINDDGLWRVAKLDRAFLKRKNTRFACALDVELIGSVVDQPGAIPVPSVTEDISRCGTAVISSLKLNVGDSVRFKSDQPRFSALAVVRNLTRLGNEQYRINLEFIGAEFPIREINGPRGEDSASVKKIEGPEPETPENELVKNGSGTYGSEDDVLESETLGSGSDESTESEPDYERIDTENDEPAAESK